MMPVFTNDFIIWLYKVAWGYRW